MEIVNTIDLRNNSKRKIFLHAAKYPASPIGGLLIGNITNDEITIENTFPLYHGTLVGPLIDIALLSIPSIYGSSSHVVGHYYSNELVVSESTPRFISNLTTSLNELNAFLTIELKKDAKLSSEVIYEVKFYRSRNYSNFRFTITFT